MNPISMTIPDDPRELRPWLEAVLVRGEVQQLAAELRAVHPGRAEGAEGHLPSEVLQEGLAALSEPDLRRLLRNPNLLVRLAEAIFITGGPYWDERLAAEVADEERIVRGWRRLEAQLPAPIPFAAAAKPRRSLAPWLASLATAAAIFLAIYLIPGARTALGPGGDSGVAARWGWQKADELPRAANAADYLDGIADLASDWKRQHTATPLALAQRIAEFRAGCARLQLMDHPPLNPEQKADLLDRCKKWAKAFDDNLALLEADPAKADLVRNQMNDKVDQLAKALHGMADKSRRAGGA